MEIIVKKKHEPWKNQLRFTPTPKNKSLIEALNKRGEHVSETINFILSDYFSKMPETRRRELILGRRNHY